MAASTAAAALLLAAGCSSSQAKAAPPGSAQVLTAYRAWWADYAAATRSVPIDPNNPRLPLHMAEPELGRIVAQLKYMVSRQQHIAGPQVDTSRAVVTSVKGSTAAVRDCYDDPSFLVNNLTNKQENNPTTLRVLATATLQNEAGGWKVTNFKSLSTGCKAANV